MGNLLSLCRILPLIIDLPDEIDTIVYSQWLLDNGFHFEYKFGDEQLKFKDEFKNVKWTENIAKEFIKEVIIDDMDTLPIFKIFYHIR